MKLTASLASAALAFCACVSASAAPLEVDICKFTLQKSMLFFSNGIGNTPQDAQTSAREAQLALMSDPQTSPLMVPIAAYDATTLYHHTDGFVQDVAKTLLQKARDESRNPNVTWDDVVALANGSSSPAISLSQMLSALSVFFLNEINQTALGQIAIDSAADAAKITAYLNTDPATRALIVGHSQGTLYANEAFENVSLARPDLTKRMRVVDVGVAANRVAGEPNPSTPPQYVTSSNDGVIGGLRLLTVPLDVGPPLPANMNAHFVRSPPGAGGLLGFNFDVVANHGFVSTYLYDTTSTYPLSTLLRNSLLEWAHVTTANVGPYLEVEMDVNVPGLPVETTYFPIQLSACTYNDTDQNFRPDSPGFVTNSGITGRQASFQFSRTPYVPASVAALQYRLHPSDGSAVGPWIPVDASKISLASNPATIPVFTYSLALRPTGYHLSIQ